MKILITSTEKNLESLTDPRFGRAKYFILMDSNTGNWEVHENTQNLNAVQGAGIQAAQNAASLNAEAVITGHIGPNAYTTLKTAGIKVYLAERESVKNNFENFQNGLLKESIAPDVIGHWV